MTKTAVLLPAYNEEVSIASMIILSENYADEVIVVDDGSNDRTAQIAEKTNATVIRHEKNKGKGVALKTGFDYVKNKDFDILVTIDADGQHNPSEIPQVIQPIVDKKADIVNGSRYINGGSKNTPTYRRVGQTVLDSATNLASGVKLTDSQSGFRAFSRYSLDHFNFDPDGFGIESDMIIEAVNNNLKICEVEITVRYDVYTTTDNPILQGLSVLMRIFEIMRFNRPLYFYGITGIVVIFFGILILLTLNMSGYMTNMYLTAMGLCILVVGIILILSGIITDTHSTLNRKK